MGGAARGAVAAASHAIINVLPLFPAASPNDAVTVCDYPGAVRPHLPS